VAQRIRALKPHTVILPYWEGRHPDHYTAARLAYEGCFLAGLKQLPIEGEAFRHFKILYSTVYYREVRPTFVVDISQFYDRRYRAILAYHSQFSPKAKDKKSKVDVPLDRLHHEVNLIARYYGQMAGVEYAEPFLVKEVMQVEDVVKLPVRSI
jgi:LmbE family N-acetylglucosaminyl deacetylase